MTAANCAEAERQKKAKADKKRKQERRQRAWHRGEFTDDDDDDDDDNDDDDDEVMGTVDDVEWDSLEGEDELTGIGSSLQALGPFPLHGGEGTLGQLVGVGRAVGLP